MDKPSAEQVKAILPYLQVIADIAIDELRARHQYKKAQDIIHNDIPDEFHKECYDKLNSVYSQRTESKEVASSISNLDVSGVKDTHIPEEHIRYLIENNAELISKSKIPAYVDMCIPELIYNISKGANIEMMYLFVLHYAITGKVYRRCSVVTVDKHKALASLAHVLISPNEQFVTSAIQELCNVETYNKLDMFQFGISMNILTKETSNIDSQTALRNFLKNKGLSDGEIEKCIKELLEMIPKSSLQSGKDKYELALKYAPIYLED